MQRSEQTDLRRNDTDKLVRDVQQAIASEDRESARLLTKQLLSEHIATLYKYYTWSSQSMDGCNLLHSRPRTHSRRECEGCCDF